MTIVEVTPAITGGVDTHRDVHVAAAVDATGATLGVECFPTTPDGLATLCAWLRGFGPIDRVGVEGTGSYGAGLARHLRAEGVEVIEVDRPNRQARRRHGKSDPADAVEAARAALSGRARGQAKAADGAVEAMRALLVVKRAGRQTRIAALTQIRHLGFCAPAELRERLRDVSCRDLAVTAAAFEVGLLPDPVTEATALALRLLGQRVLELDADARALDAVLAELVTDTAPALLAVPGVGTDTAAELLVAAGDNPERLRSEPAWAHLCGVAPVPASSGQVIRWRLNRAGNRRANHALWRIVFARMSWHPPTKTYVARRLAQGRSKPEIMRCLKRYVAREVYRHLPRP